MEKESAEITNMGVKCILDGLYLHSDLKGLFYFHIATHAITAKASGEVTQQHAVTTLKLSETEKINDNPTTDQKPPLGMTEYTAHRIKSETVSHK